MPLAGYATSRSGAVERMNRREMRRLGVSRRQLFETVERPLMQALPQDDYEYAEWHLARVGIDYHVEVHGFLYSVPHRYELHSEIAKDRYARKRM
jgi:hypothetical protein